MFRNILFAIVLVLLGVSFYFSRHFQLIAAGVAVLLFGMRFLEHGFESAATGALYRALKKISNNLFLSFMLGMLSTAVLQSSSLITVIAISFLSTGLLSLRSGLGIVFGANIGTTTTAWIVAFLGIKLNISTLALPMIFFGILLQNRSVSLQRAIGNILLGLGGFFMGIYLMQLGFADLDEGLLFTSQNTHTAWVLVLALLSGVALTAVLQSSSATMAIILTALGAGQIDFMQSLALAIGANIGTTVTALLGALNVRVAGKQLALGHFIFNVLTALVALLLLPLFVLLVEKSAALLDLENADLSLRLAVFHSLFNVLGVLLIMPFIGKLERLLLRIPFKKQTDEKPKYLVQDVEKVPQSAYLALHKETHHVLHVLVNKMQAVLLQLPANYKKGFFGLLTTAESPAFTTTYYNSIKPILAAIQQLAARLSGTYKTQHFAVISRLISEISRDFDHIVKAVNQQEFMEQKAYSTLYFDLLHELTETVSVVAHGLTEGSGTPLETLIDDRKAAFDAFNADLDDRINALIVQSQLSPLAGTTAIHTADYTKRIIHKLNRTVHLLYTVNYLELEAKMEFEEG